MRAIGGVAILLALVAVGRTQQSTTGVAGESPTPEGPKEASYWITFNTKVRPGQTMYFNVHILKGTMPVSVIASLLDNEGKKVLLTSKATACQPGEVQVIPIALPYDIEKPSTERWQNNYNVRVVGVGDDVKFTEEGYATLQDKAFSIFIQTDKAMYKPRQEVKFRVAAASPDLKMMVDAVYDITIVDSKGNSILQYRAIDAPMTMGVAERSFRLADNIPVGEWTITATVMGFTTSKAFTVSDYVLPKYEVEIIAPEFGISNDTHLEFTVEAKYTFGKPVSDSDVEVKIETLRNNWYYRSESVGIRPSINLRGKLNRNGQYDVKVETESLLGLVRDYNAKVTNLDWQKFLINTTVTEARTKKKRSAQHEIYYYPTPMKMQFLSITPKSYKAGLNFTAYLEVRKRDGSLFTPEESKNIKIRFSATYDVLAPPPKERSTVPPPPEITRSTKNENSSFPSIIAKEEAVDRIWNPNFYERYLTKVINLTNEAMLQDLPDNGWLIIKFEVPEKANIVRIRAESDGPFNETDYTTYYGQPAKSPTNSFLQLNVTNHKPKVKDIVKVKAKATEPIQALNYMLSSKGTLLHSERVEPASPTNEIEFEFLVEAAMSPNLNLLAFYVREDGEFVVDALSLSVEGLFSNPVDIKFSKDRVKPGESVDVIIRAPEESMVFLLAVDKSVKLLKSGNDITQELVREELLRYEHGGNYGFWRYMFVCGWPSYNSGTDAASVFSSAGVQVLTDGNVYSDNTFFWNRPVMERDSSVVDSSTQEKEPEKTSESVKIRREFPENWLWSIVTIDNESGGEVRKSLVAPDTITSWVASGFSTHPVSGLSVGAEPAEVTTFRDMFVVLELPSSIVRNEEFCFTVSVFSYYKDDIPVSVKLVKSPDFSSIFTKKEGKKVYLEKQKLHYTIVLGMMSDGDIESAMFCFTPEVLGSIPVQVIAETNVPGLSDAVERKLRVKPEGVPRTTTKPFLIAVENGQWNENVTLRYPPSTVKGSEKLVIYVAGNVLGSMFENMDNLIKQPYGCGEQNMINFSPLMSLMKFFLLTDTATPEIKKKISDFMLQGYQKELNYEHGMSGGYSAFGNNNNVNVDASTWLTAFILKCFAQAKQLNTTFSNELDIDINAIARSARWMTLKQNRQGHFVETGKVYNSRLQGGSGDGIALTAYSVIALHEAHQVLDKNSSEYSKVKSSLMTAVTYLEMSIPKINDPYELCITAYALHLLNSRQKDTVFRKMEHSAFSGSGMKYWERMDNEPVSPYNYYWTNPHTALSVEMTSYALLTYALRNIARTDGLSILNWLSKQQNPKGGFISTQDTVIGIEALTTVAAHLFNAEYVPMTVRVSAGNVDRSFNMVKENEMILNTFEVPYESIGNGVVNMQATANRPVNAQTTVLVDIVMEYNVEQKSENSVYTLTHLVQGDELVINIATVNGEKASMTILEIELPAGRTADEKEVELANPAISNAELKSDDLFVLYFNTDVVDGEGVEVVMPLIRTGGELTKAKPKTMKLYSYYEPGADLTVDFSMGEESLEFCSIVPSVGVCPYQ